MNKRIPPLLAAMALGLCPFASANDIEPGKEEYKASPAATSITLDGVLDEWSGVPVLSDPKFYTPEGSAPNGTLVLFEEWEGGTWTGPDDQTSAIQFVWDADNIYIGIVVTDDYHENAANSAWNGDSAQLLFCSPERIDGGPHFLYNFALGGVEGALGDVIIGEERVEEGPGGVEGVVTRNAETKKTTYELRIPATALNLPSFTDGQQLGVGMALNDGDEDTPGQKGWGGWGVHALVNLKNPSQAGLLTLQSSEPTIEVLGVGTESLEGGDLTDPENDGDETLGPDDPSWNWVSITSSIEGFFDGAEGAFNVFDNQVGGGANKWCCDDATDAAPQWISVEFPNPLSLTHFTMTSGNDTPGRDPHYFEIQGSNDGLNFTPIYTRASDTSLWTARDQVIKITLPNPAPPYRHIRYFVTHTPADLHQLGEIEYFGIFGSADLAFLSAINPVLDRFSFRATDVGESIVDAENSTLMIDGAAVELASSKSGDATDFEYVPSSPFLPGSEHTYEIAVKDTQGNTISSEGTFLVPAYALLTADDMVTPDTSKPGFIWRVHQNDAFQATTINRALNQLAGNLGENFADPFAFGWALAQGAPGVNVNMPLTFELETTINMDETGFGSNGEFVPDDPMPGIPGLSGDGLNGIAAEITAYVELPAGKHTFIVNSDDGFLTTAGRVNDVFLAQTAGLFNAGRGASDTVYTIYAQEAGVYPIRTVWFEGASGANIEWKTEKPDGTRVLLNDTFNGGFQTYRAAMELPTGISSVTPSRNAVGAAGDASVAATITEGAQAVDVGSVALSINGTPTGASATSDNGIITISHQPDMLFPAGSTNTATISYTAGGTARTETWQFVVADYAYLTADLRVTPDTTKPGFIFNVHQNEAFTATDNTRPALQLAGELGVNYADPFVQGPALAPGTPGANDRMPVMFEIPTVINLDQAFGANGEFQPDEQMPGIPGTSINLSTDGIAAEILTYIELPAGRNTLIVNSDDGFRTTGGNVKDVQQAQLLGQFVGGRGAADTAYTFYVEEAGFYPIRTIWYEGGGGANIEWKYVNPDGTRVLINDTANGGPAAYRAVTEGAAAPAITQLSPRPDDNKVLGSAAIEVMVQEGSTPVDDGSVELTLDGGAATAAVDRSGNVLTISHQPGQPLAPGSHAAMVRFTYGGTERVAEWSFIVPPAVFDLIEQRPALLLGTAVHTPDGGGHTGAAGDYAIDFGTAGNTQSVLIPDASFLNETAFNDVMTFAFWQKKYDTLNSSAFWADSPSSPSGMRGFQAHVPWSDNNVYFDSSGCCAADLTRVSAGIDTFPGYTGPEWWTSEWHHWAFVKDGFSKRIYIDGQLFLDAFGDPLKTDFARIWLGAEGGGPGAGTLNNMHGLMDDFAVFASALTQAQVEQLANGTAPADLGASALAHWDFNTPPETPDEAPVITINRAGADITITWINGGSLEASPVAGAGAVWTAVDSDGSYTTTAAGTAMFYRVSR